MWVSIATVLGRVSSLLSQLVLGAVIAKEDFGIFSIAFAFTQLGRSLQGSGIERWLIHRGKDFCTLASPFFGIVMWLSWGTALLLAAASPLAARLYDISQLIPLIAIIALSLPLYSYSKVYQAKLSIDQDFRTLALSTSGTEASRHVFQVLFAIFGCGVYSFVYPLLIAPWIGLYLAFKKAGRLPPSPVTARSLAPEFLRDYKWILITGFAFVVVTQGNNIVAGYFCSTKDAGTFFFAYLLTMAITHAFATGINAVMMPTFTKLEAKPDYQLAKYLVSVRVFSTVIVPLCFLHAAMAHFYVPLVWNNKWNESIEITQVLSITIPFALASSISAALMESRGQWRSNGTLFAFRAAGTLLSAWIGVRLSGVYGIALGSLLFQFCYCLFQGGYVCRTFRNMSTFLVSFAVPIVASSIMFWGSPIIVEWTRIENSWLKLFAVAIIFSLGYAGLFFVAARNRLLEAINMFSRSGKATRSVVAS